MKKKLLFLSCLLLVPASTLSMNSEPLETDVEQGRRIGPQIGIDSTNSHLSRIVDKLHSMNENLRGMNERFTATDITLQKIGLMIVALTTAVIVCSGVLVTNIAQLRS